MKECFRWADGPCPVLGRCTHLSTSLVAVAEHPSGSSSPQNPDKPQSKKLWGQGVLRDTMTCPCPQKGHLPCSTWANLTGEQSSSMQDAVAPGNSSSIVLKTPEVQRRSCHCSLHHPALQGSMVCTRIIPWGSRPARQTRGTQGGSCGSCSAPTHARALAGKGQDSGQTVLLKDHDRSRATTPNSTSCTPEPRKAKLMEYARLCRSHKTMGQTSLACANWCSWTWNKATNQPSLLT